MNSDGFCMAELGSKAAGVKLSCGSGADVVCEEADLRPVSVSQLHHAVSLQQGRSRGGIGAYMVMLKMRGGVKME